MQLLSPTQVKNISREAETNEKRKLADLTVKVLDKAKELNNLQVDIDRNVKAEQERIIARNDEIIALNEEIQTLENTRKKLMIPVNILKENLEAELRTTLQLKHSLTQKEIDLNEQREKLFKKTEELTEWEQQLNNQIDSIRKDEQLVKLERAELKRISLQLQTQMADYTTKIDEMNQYYRDRESKLEQGSYALQVKELTFAQQQEEWENIKAKEQRQLADQRATLERAINRLKK